MARPIIVTSKVLSGQHFEVFVTVGGFGSSRPINLPIDVHDQVVGCVVDQWREQLGLKPEETVLAREQLIRQRDNYRLIEQIAHGKAS